MHNLILKYKLQRHYKTHARKAQFLNLQDIRTALVLFDTAHQAEAARCIDRLKSLGKTVAACAWQAKQDVQDYAQTGWNIVAEKSIRPFSHPVYALAKTLKTTSFDALINLDVRQNCALAYLAALASASIKTGWKQSPLPHYDLAIVDLPAFDTEALQVEELARQILHYLDCIQSSAGAVPASPPSPHPPTHAAQDAQNSDT